MLDGTHVPLARWKGLIDYFGTAKNGKKKGHQRPQARMVMLALAQTRTPWRYEITPWSTHEQAIPHRLLVGLRANDLVLMDRGFLELCPVFGKLLSNTLSSRFGCGAIFR